MAAAALASLLLVFLALHGLAITTRALVITARVVRFFTAAIGLAAEFVRALKRLERPGCVWTVAVLIGMDTLGNALATPIHLLVLQVHLVVLVDGDWAIFRAEREQLISIFCVQHRLDERGAAKPFGSAHGSSHACGRVSRSACCTIAVFHCAAGCIASRWRSLTRLHHGLFHLLLM